MSLCSKCPYGTGKNHDCKHPAKKGHKSHVLRLRRCKYYPKSDVTKHKNLAVDKIAGELDGRRKAPKNYPTVHSQRARFEGQA